MSPVEYIRRTRERFARRGFPPYQWTVNQTPPFTPFQKPLAKCRVALISSGGIYIRDNQPAFDPERDDLTFREIPKDVNVNTLAISHNHYDRSGAEKDINCVFPIERMRKLEKEGLFRELAPVNYTFMGRIFKRTQLQKEMATDLLRRLKENRVDVFFMVPV